MITSTLMLLLWVLARLRRVALRIHVQVATNAATLEVNMDTRVAALKLDLNMERHDERA